jgi:hypothetical protein
VKAALSPAFATFLTGEAQLQAVSTRDSHFFAMKQLLHILTCFCLSLFFTPLQQVQTFLVPDHENKC